MAPRPTPKVERTIVKTNNTKKLPPRTTAVSSPDSNVIKTRQRSNTVPKELATPKPKENKPTPMPQSVTKSAKKSWKRRPKPAHSGVPVPEKMKKLMQSCMNDCSF